MKKLLMLYKKYQFSEIDYFFSKKGMVLYPKNSKKRGLNYSRKNKISLYLKFKKSNTIKIGNSKKLQYTLITPRKLKFRI